MQEYFVHIDDYIGPFKAQTTGDTWNGWACPTFDFDTACDIALGIMAGTADMLPGFAAYDPESDTFWLSLNGDIASIADVDNEYDEYTRDATGRYPIGTHGWCWEEVDVDHLARAFANIVEDELTEEEFAEMRRRNATPGYAKACASHDFRDANEMMSEAFRNYFGRDADPTRQADTDVWNAAWEIARWRDLTDPGLR